MESIQDLVTSDDYIRYYYQQIKDELNARGYVISKVGIVGILMYILGNTQYDIKTYYDRLFKEMFLGTADRYEDLNLHGMLYNFPITLSTPASISGTLDFNYNILPTYAQTGTAYLKFQSIKILIGDIVYTLESTYNISGNVCQIVNVDGEIINVPFTMTNPNVPIVDFYQYETQEFSFTVPFYVFGTYYTKEILFSPDGYLTGVDVYVTETGSTTETKYSTNTVNYSSTANEETVFIRYLSYNKILIEFGSGIHGKYVPNSTIRVRAKISQGEKGNISTSQTDIKPIDGSIYLYTKDDNGNITSTYTSKDILRFVNINVEYADGGENTPTGDDLRQQIITFVRSRLNLMSESDFYDNITPTVPEFMLMFKKTHIVDNIIYCFLIMRNSYAVPDTIQSLTVKYPVFNPNNSCYVYRPMFTVNNKSFISPFLYVVDNMMRYYKGYIVKESFSTYFTQVVAYNTSTESIPLTIRLEYNSQLDSTRFIIQSYQDISTYSFFITIKDLDIENQCMGQYSSTEFDYYWQDLSTSSGFIFDALSIQIDLWESTTKKFTYTVSNISMIYDISDILTLKSWDGEVSLTELPVSSPNTDGSLLLDSMFSDDSYIIHIPIMLYSTFSSNEDYYINKILTLFSDITTPAKRMISDDFQIRFINTDYVSGDVLKYLTTQAYTFNLQLPLLMTLNIIAFEDVITTQKLNIYDEKKSLTTKIAQKLNDDYTGNSMSIYKSQLLQIIHSYEWVKSVDLTIVDSDGTTIPNGEFELVDQKEVFRSLSKKDSIIFCPLYIWWDINNITINITYE